MTRVHNIRDEFAAVAQRVPGGFAGAYFDDTGAFTVLLTDLSRQSGAVDALQSERFVDQRGLDLANARLRSATYAYDELYGWYNELRRSVPLTPISLRIDVRRNQVVIGVTNAAEQEDVQNVIDQTGIPTEAVSAEVETPMRLLGDLRDKFRPVPGGVKIQWQEFDVPWADAITCTIGPQFEAHRDGYDPVEGFLVNSHCTRAPFDSAASASDPTTYHQATVGDNIGEEVFDPDTWSCTDNPQYGCRGSDAALAVYYADESVGPQLGRIARTDSRNDANYSITLDGTQPRFEVTSALGQYSLQGETLEKVGQLTGWTGGTVINGCVDYPITDGGIVVGPTLVCQVAVAAEAGPGDSGSPVFKIDAGIEVHLRGMLVGGRGECHYINIEGAFVCEEFVASHLGDIEYELGPLLTWYWY